MTASSARRSIPFLVGLVVLASTACSFPEQFFILNRSLKPVVIVATADVYPHAETGAPVCAWSPRGQSPLPLKKVPAERLGRRTVGLGDKADVVGATFDEQTCSVTTTVEPASAVGIWGSINRSRIPFLSSIKIGEKETLSKTELLKRFEKRSRFVYVLEMK